jgi:hypothetical protein
MSESNPVKDPDLYFTALHVLVRHLHKKGVLDQDEYLAGIATAALAAKHAGRDDLADGLAMWIDRVNTMHRGPPEDMH